MLIFFLGLGGLGNTLINTSWLPYTSLLGCIYIIYVALKVFKASVEINQSPKQEKNLSIWDGLLMQLLNPKGLIAALPIATIQFPAEGIQGGAIILWSIGLSVLAFGAPFSYSLIGGLLGKKLNSPLYFKTFNILMSLLLISVAINIAYKYVFLKLI